MANWFANGIRFSCRKCRSCCSGAPGMVWVTLEEIARISDYLGMSTQDFGKKYLRLVDRRLSLTERPNYDCVFLGDSGCQIYPVRPAQCKTFPFWKELMHDEEAWRRATEFCPGVVDGRLYTEEEILRILEREDATKADCD